MLFFLRFLSLTLILSLTAGGESQPAMIHISGSATMMTLTRRLTEWYGSRNHGAAFHVDGAGPTQGFSALIEGRSEIAQSSRRVLDGEVLALRSHRQLNFVEIPVATEVAVIAVNSANPVRTLSVFDLRLILSGRVKNWKQIGGNDAPIQLFGRDETSAVRAMIDEDFMGDASFSSSIVQFSANSSVLSAVAEHANAIAFCTVDLHPPKGVRLIGIKASASAEVIEPTGDNIRAHRYTLSRTLYYYFAGRPAAELLKFAEWVLSPEGQLVVEAVGLYPLGSVDRELARSRLGK